MLPVARNQRGMGAIPRYQFLPGEREVAFYRAGYDGEVRGVDAAIGGLLAALRQAALLEQTVVVLAADHGEGLGENDYWFSHGEYLSDALVRIPLLIRVPGRPGGRRSDVASLLDVMPTVASLLGVDADVGMESLCQGTETPESICITALEDGVSLLPIVQSTTEAPIPTLQMVYK